MTSSNVVAFPTNRIGPKELQTINDAVRPWGGWAVHSQSEAGDVVSIMTPLSDWASFGIGRDRTGRFHVVDDRGRTVASRLDLKGVLGFLWRPQASATPA